MFQLDPRLDRQPGERIIAKRYASSFKGANLHENLTALGADTLIVAGVSTSHCVYARPAAMPPTASAWLSLAKL